MPRATGLVRPSLSSPRSPDKNEHNLPVRRVGRHSAGVADRGRVHALEPHEHVLGAPKTSHPEHDCVHPVRHVVDRVARDEVGRAVRRHGGRRRARARDAVGRGQQRSWLRARHHLRGHHLHDELQLRRRHLVNIDAVRAEAGLEPRRDLHRRRRGFVRHEVDQLGGRGNTGNNKCLLRGR